MCSSTLLEPPRPAGGAYIADDECGNCGAPLRAVVTQAFDKPPALRCPRCNHLEMLCCECPDNQTNGFDPGLCNACPYLNEETQVLPAEEYIGLED